MDSLAIKLEFDDEFGTTPAEGGEDSQTTTPVKPVKPKRERKEREPGMQDYPNIVKSLKLVVHLHKARTLITETISD